jgi:hypothetical protein
MAQEAPARTKIPTTGARPGRRLCERFAAPVIGAVLCQDIKTGHMQRIVNAAPTPGEGGRVRGMISALVAAGLEGGYLASSRLAKVHWQAGDRLMPPPRATVAGESVLWVDPAAVPADAAGHGRWTWHSLWHVFCTTLFTWKLEATDVSRMAGHANYRITLDMYVGTAAGVLDRARTATQ